MPFAKILFVPAKERRELPGPAQREGQLLVEFGVIVVGVSMSVDLPVFFVQLPLFVVPSPMLLELNMVLG